MNNIYITTTGSTPIGPLWIAVNGRGELARIEFGGTLTAFSEAVEAYVRKHTTGESQIQCLPDAKRTAEINRQLCEYLVGTRREFTFPIAWSWMPTFQRLALQATYAIPYGQITTYQAVAAQIGHPRAARAVGRAEATNPIPLVIPCHRVLGSDGKLHGYGGPGGIQLKEWLLKLERG
jgi:methylated-DNA-[protein]-cysteine S-methyltransferase